MSFPRYPKYKPSGVEWLGEVPEHWAVAPLCARAAERRSRNEGMQEDNLLSLSYGNIVRKDIASNDGLLPESFETYQIVEPGDTVLRLTDLQNDQRSIRTGVVRERGIITSAYLAIRPVSIDADYLSLLLRAYDSQKAFYSMGSGLRQSMKYDDLKRLPLLVPQPAEQRAIAAFLDRETAKIDALIAEQEKLSELLAEKRQAVISHAVTKGLNPAAPMKPSGVEWLGDVPAHWDLVRLGYRGSLQNGLSIGGDAFGAGDPFVSYGDVYKNAVLPEVPSGLVLSTSQDQDKYSVEVGDVLFTRTSETTDDIGVASTCLRTIPRATFAGFLIRFRPHREVLVAQYAVYLFRNQAVARHFAGTMNIVTRASLSQGELRSLPICVPPPGEQRTIAEFLDRELAKFDALIEEAESAVALLVERRSALISAAVTGQIDVRNAVPETAA